MESRPPFFAALVAVALLAPLAVAAEPGPAPAPDPLESWWKHTRARIERALEEQGRTPEAVENPKWFEQPYSTVGRMPLVDIGLGQPLVLPEVAGYFDRRVREAKGSLASLLEVAAEIAAAAKSPSPPAPNPNELSPEDVARVRAAVDPLCAALKDRKIGDAGVRAIGGLASAVAHAHLLREKAFAALSPADRKALAESLPAYFVRKTPAGEQIRGYTAQIDDVPELLDLLRKVDFTALHQAGAVLARAVDAFREAVKEAAGKDLAAAPGGILHESDAFFGRIVIAGTGPDSHARDAALLVDLGGDDVYANRAAATSPEGPGAALLVDLSGDDRYLASGFAQACAFCGAAALLDLAGDDTYVSGHYSQGAALCGYAFFCDESGDDSYRGELGVQCFAMFGASVFREGGGRDSYRCASMGQACASTLGVAVLDEAGGDDVYRSGGKHGFYETWDASCAQGAASGMRPWPTHGRTTVYGGVGFLSEAAGNDVYSAYIIGQGGSYIFSLGMLVDSAGDDVYSALRYCRGVGVHIGAAVAIDRKGDDVHTGFYGNDSMSLDRSSGLFLDLEGDDVYRVAAGLGYCNKPRGCSVFVDARGNDSYGGDVNTFGSCNPLYSEDTESTAFFFDFGGRDAYPKGRMANDAKWGERAFGVGLDEEVREPERGKQPWWEPAGLPEGAGSAAGFASASPLVRFAAQRGLADPARGGIDALLAVASGGHAFARRDLVDAVRQWLNAKKLSAADAGRLLPLLSSPDKDLRLLALFAWMNLKSMSPEAVREAGRLAQFDASPDVRGVACLALGKSASKDALPCLLSALKAANPSVRRRAAIGLSDLKAPESFPDLLSVLASDPEPDPRAHAADALGALGEPKAVPALQAALLDRDGLVRFYAARALLKDFGRAGAMEHMIGLARWDAGALRDLLVWGFLKAYAGKELPGTEADWKAWWAEAGKEFDAGRAGQVYARCVDAEEAARQGDPEKAIGIYREIRKLDPRHAGACEEVSKALNSRAWGIATSGKDYAEGLKLAEEAADAKADPDVVDTLAVLQYLTGDKKKAEETVRKALETVKGDKAEMLVRRLEEFKTGKLELH